MCLRGIICPASRVPSPTRGRQPPSTIRAPHADANRHRLAMIGSPGIAPTPNSSPSNDGEGNVVQPEAGKGLMARINGVALNTSGENLSAEELRQRACTELLRQAAEGAGLLDAADIATADGI